MSGKETSPIHLATARSASGIHGSGRRGAGPAGGEDLEQEPVGPLRHGLSVVFTVAAGLASLPRAGRQLHGSG